MRQHLVLIWQCNIECSVEESLLILFMLIDPLKHLTSAFYLQWESGDLAFILGSNEHIGSNVSMTSGVDMLIFNPFSTESLTSAALYQLS